jgi:hypothetical protein
MRKLTNEKLEVRNEGVYMLKYCICILLLINITFSPFNPMVVDMLLDIIFIIFEIPLIIEVIIFWVFNLTVFIIFTSKIASVIYSWGEHGIVKFIKCSFFGLILLLYIRYISLKYIDLTEKGGWEFFNMIPHKYSLFPAILALLVPIKNESTMKLPKPIQIVSASFYIFIFTVLLCVLVYNNAKNICVDFGSIWIVPVFIFMGITVPISLLMVLPKIIFVKRKEVVEKDNKGVKAP